MTPPALFALGASTLVCTLTASASVFGWPAELRRRQPPPPHGLAPAEAAALLALVPPGATVRIEAVEEAPAWAFAQAARLLFIAEGRRVEDRTVFTVRGIQGAGYLHSSRAGRHALLVMGRPEPPPVTG